MTTITHITKVAAAAARVESQQRLQQYRSIAEQAISPALEEKLEQHGVSVHFSNEARAYLNQTSTSSKLTETPAPLWVSVFKRLGLL